MPNRHHLCTPSPSISLFLFIFFFSRHPPVHCGYPGLGLECPYGYHYPILNLPGDAYFVTDINYNDETLTLVDINVTDVAGQGCPRARHNLTIGSLPLGYNSADVNLTFFFNCNTSLGMPIDTVAIDCLLSGDKRSYVFVNMSREEEAAFDEVWDCEEMVVAAVKGTEVTAANVVERFAGAMSQGFVLDWEAAKECGTCEHSGGRCAFNQTKQVQCFCNDESIHADGSACKGKNEVCVCQFSLPLFVSGFCILFANRHAYFFNACHFLVACDLISAICFDVAAAVRI
ncbi:uncharacterized protein LOC130140286 [Syzygium oleosum]|uniref:uncharacterized protein LOC130140286 n=1 Tax=Syzygium oleosum TaxID=219896 RepID=UPI0024BA6370|nr:uncharacterized protein LOC130140286 [Syzygium oleosum]